MWYTLLKDGTKVSGKLSKTKEIIYLRKHGGYFTEFNFNGDAYFDGRCWRWMGDGDPRKCPGGVYMEVGHPEGLYLKYMDKQAYKDTIETLVDLCLRKMRI